jgi:hypothetical protein
LLYPMLRNPKPLRRFWPSSTGLFTRERGRVILRSSLPTGNAQATPKIAHSSDTPAPIREYARHVTDKGTL